MMARRRNISTDISTDPKLARLSQHGTLAMLLYTWAIPHMDDWGRMSGDPIEFKLQVCPALSIDVGEVQEALELIDDHGLWQLYAVKGKQYVAIDKERWFKHQSYINKDKRADDSASQFPSPQSADDCQESPQNTVEWQKSPENPVSPSPSPSPSGITSEVADAPSDPPRYRYETDHEELAELLDTRIRENNPKAKGLKIPKEANTVRLMIERDERTVDEIRSVIEWSQSDDFWFKNILSMGKLREKFDRLWLDMQSDSSNKSPPHTNGHEPDRETRLAAWRTDRDRKAEMADAMGNHADAERFRQMEEPP